LPIKLAIRRADPQSVYVRGFNAAKVLDKSRSTPFFFIDVDWEALAKPPDLNPFRKMRFCACRYRMPQQFFGRANEMAYPAFTRNEPLASSDWRTAIMPGCIDNLASAH